MASFTVRLLSPRPSVRLCHDMCSAPEPAAQIRSWLPPGMDRTAPGGSGKMERSTKGTGTPPGRRRERPNCGWHDTLRKETVTSWSLLMWHVIGDLEPTVANGQNSRCNEHLLINCSVTRPWLCSDGTPPTSVSALHTETRTVSYYDTTNVGDQSCTCKH